jgi:hypothetical protein
MGHKVAGVSTLDRPYVVLSVADPVCQRAISVGKAIGAYVLPVDHDIDLKLEFGGNIVHMYEEDTLYVFEVPTDVDLNPNFQEEETVDVVGLNGAIRWRTKIRIVGKKCVVTSCNRRWTHDGKLISTYGTYLDLQLRRTY